MEIIALTIIILGSVILFATRLVPIEVTAIGILSALALTGILEPHEVLLGFSSQATITVAAMFILSTGLARTGVVELLTKRIYSYCSLPLRVMLLLFSGAVALCSAFTNNTPVVVIMVPVLLGICRRSTILPSKVFIPISYFAIMGGTCTLIGTSTNILIDDIFRQAGGTGFGIFDFTPLGAIYLLIGTTAIVLLGPRLLPMRESLTSILPVERSARFVTELVVKPDAHLVGRRVDELFGPDQPLRLLEIIRGEMIIMSSRIGTRTLEPQDALIVEGSPREISNLLTDAEGLELGTVVEDQQRVPMRTIELKLVEAVVLPESPFQGRVVGNLGLHRLYGVKVLAIQRHGRQHRYQIRAMRLHAGDVLLLQADEQGLDVLRESGAVLIVEGVEQTVHRRKKMPVALTIMAAVIISAAFFGLPLAVTALTGTALMLLTRCVRIDEAVRSLDMATLLLLAGTIPLGMAMLKTGLAEAIVAWVMGTIGHSPPWVMLSALYLLTAILTSFMSNNAAAVLLAPIAFDMAQTLNVDAHPLMLAVAFGASASFATPIAYQTNLIVMGPGGYRFSDYLRLGIPLTLIMWLAATLLIPLFWPL